MKLYIALLLLVITSCSKTKINTPTKINSPIVGSWALDSIYVSINGGGWKPAVTNAPVVLMFSEDGSFFQKNTNYSQYNHFEIISNNSLRLYNTLTKQELIIRYRLDDKLTIISCVEECAEKYKRN